MSYKPVMDFEVSNVELDLLTVLVSIGIFQL